MPGDKPSKPALPGGVPRDMTWDQPTTDVRELAEQQAKALANALAAENERQEAEKQLGEMKLKLAALFGVFGRPGILAAMDKQMADQNALLVTHSGWLTELREFKGRVIWIATGVLAAGGALAGLAWKLIERALTGHW